MNLNMLFVLCPLIFLAGFVDSIAGGGGLISLTAYMACGLPVTTTLGTNKFSAGSGAVISSVNYIKTQNYDLIPLIGSFICALIGSWLGTSATLLIDEKIFSVVILVITPIIAIFVLLKKDYSKYEKNYPVRKKLLISVPIGLIVGFYDGFYGPGTGTFLRMGFIVLAGISTKKACGNACIVNLGSNIGSLVNFIINENVLYQVAVPCALCSIIGNYLGSKLAIKKDVKIIKPLMLVVISLLIIKILIEF